MEEEAEAVIPASHQVAPHARPDSARGSSRSSRAGSRRGRDKRKDDDDDDDGDVGTIPAEQQAMIDAARAAARPDSSRRSSRPSRGSNGSTAGRDEVPAAVAAPKRRTLAGMTAKRSDFDSKERQGRHGDSGSRERAAAPGERVVPKAVAPSSRPKKDKKGHRQRSVSSSSRSDQESSSTRARRKRKEEKKRKRKEREEAERQAEEEEVPTAVAPPSPRRHRDRKKERSRNGTGDADSASRSGEEHNSAESVERPRSAASSSSSRRRKEKEQRKREKKERKKREKEEQRKREEREEAEIEATAKSSSSSSSHHRHEDKRHDEAASSSPRKKHDPEQASDHEASHHSNKGSNSDKKDKEKSPRQPRRSHSRSSHSSASKSSGRGSKAGESSSVSDAGSLLEYDADELVDHITEKVAAQTGELTEEQKRKQMEDLKALIDAEHGRESGPVDAGQSSSDDATKKKKKKKKKKKDKKGKEGKEYSSYSFDPDDSDSSARRARHERRRLKRESRLAKAKERRLQKKKKGGGKSSSSSSSTSDSAALDPNLSEGEIRRRKEEKRRRKAGESTVVTPADVAPPPDPEGVERVYPDPVKCEITLETRVQCAMLAPIGTLNKVIAVAGMRNGRVVGHDVATGAVEIDFSGHMSEIRSIDCDLQNGTVYTGSKDCTVRAFKRTEHPKTLDIVKNPKFHRKNSVQPPPKFEMCNEWSNHEGAVNVVKVCQGWQRVISGGMDGMCYVYNTQSGDMVDKYVGHTGPIVCIDVKGNMVATGSEDKKVIVWNRSKGQALYTFEGHTALISAVQFVTDHGSQENEDVTFLASASWDASIRIWNCDTQVDEVILPQTGRVFALTSTQGTKIHPPRLVSIAEDCHVRVWDWRKKVCLAVYKSPVSIRSCKAYGNDLITSAAQHPMRVWDASLSFQTPLIGMTEHSGAINYVRYSKDEETIITASRDGTLRLWQASSGVLQATFDAEVELWCGAVTPDRTFVCGGCEDSLLRVWKVDDPDEVVHSLTMPDVVSACAISNQGDRAVAGAYDGAIMSWSAKMWVEMGTYVGHSATIVGLEYAEDDKALFSASEDMTVRVWNTTTRDVMQAVPMDTPIRSMAVSAGLIACALEDASIYVHDLRLGHCLTQLKGHNGRISCVRFTDKRGRGLVSSSWDNTVRVWNVRESREVVALTSHGNAVVSSLDISAKRLEIVSGGRDKRVHIQTLNPIYVDDWFEGEKLPWMPVIEEEDNQPVQTTDLSARPRGAGATNSLSAPTASDDDDVNGSSSPRRRRRGPRKPRRSHSTSSSSSSSGKGSGSSAKKKKGRPHSSSEHSADHGHGGDSGDGSASKERGSHSNSRSSSRSRGKKEKDHDAEGSETREYGTDQTDHSADDPSPRDVKKAGDVKLGRHETGDDFDERM
eukprot:TRINITY_DN2398_c0_g1_i3.p1 TRINITY_DN2398_c0_g1~~TRINITY_DN2398_c0_g1_i3.p1  ORF type:complete len:1400 (+),score=333.02 TRINITY_DN2398_c0_g1_i3:623-4822(+)